MTVANKVQAIFASISDDDLRMAVHEIKELEERGVLPVGVVRERGSPRSSTARRLFLGSQALKPYREIFPDAYWQELEAMKALGGDVADTRIVFWFD